MDDILVLSKDLMKVINDLRTVYTMKGVGTPEYFLGGNIEELGPEWNKEAIKMALSACTKMS